MIHEKANAGRYVYCWEIDSRGTGIVPAVQGRRRPESLYQCQPDAEDISTSEEVVRNGGRSY
jgi:hypothetical protein